MGKKLFTNKKILAVLGCLILFLVLLLIPTLNVRSQTTPTVNPQSTATASAQETPSIELTKASLEIEKLRHENDWWWSNRATILTTALSTAILLFSGLAGFLKWLNEQRKERRKQDEDRFQEFIKGLGSEYVDARVGAAIMLLTFLQKGYEKFYSQVFHLAVAHLRLRRTEPGSSDPPDALSRALIIVFRDAFPKAQKYVQSHIRDYIGDDNQVQTDEDRRRIIQGLLNATGINLDQAYLSFTDLSEVYMRDSTLRGVHFYKAKLIKANFKHSRLTGANFEHSISTGVNLTDTDLSKANLKHAKLEEASFVDSCLEFANLKGADLTDANFKGANLSNADLTDTNLELAKSLEGTILLNVKGLSSVQLANLVARGAIINEGLI